MQNGLQDIITKTKKYTSLMSKKHEVDIESMNSVQIIEFNNQHIERSKVVRKILDIYAVDSIQEKQDTRKVESKNTATQEEQNELFERLNITSSEELPEISRFDPVAKAIGLRPGQLCHIERKSPTAFKTDFYRYCVA